MGPCNPASYKCKRGGGGGGGGSGGSPCVGPSRAGVIYLAALGKKGLGGPSILARGCIFRVWTSLLPISFGFHHALLVCFEHSAHMHVIISNLLNEDTHAKELPYA